jgi:hypothetical protein
MLRCLASWCVGCGRRRCILKRTDDPSILTETLDPFLPGDNAITLKSGGRDEECAVGARDEAVKALNDYSW